MIEITCLEKDIEDYLCTNNNLQKHLGLRLLAREYPTPTGLVDIIAYNNRTKRFVVIELKNDTLDYKDFFQLERYADYFKKKELVRAEVKDMSYFNAKKNGKQDYHAKAKCERKFDCLLIGKKLSSDLNYSVEHWENDSDIQRARMWYTCFGYNFNKPLSFDYYSPAQIKIEQEELYYEK